jgi:hypothetical protein
MIQTEKEFARSAELVAQNSVGDIFENKQAPPAEVARHLNRPPGATPAQAKDDLSKTTIYAQAALS